MSWAHDVRRELNWRIVRIAAAVTVGLGALFAILGDANSLRRDMGIAVVSAGLISFSVLCLELIHKHEAEERGELRRDVEKRRTLALALSSSQDLRSLDLRGADLRNFSFRNRNLKDANLSGANLAGVDLRGADLRGAILLGTDFSGAVIAGADFSDAIVVSSRFDEATSEAPTFGLHRVESKPCTVWSSFCRALLINCNFDGSRLRTCDFSDAEISGCSFNGSELLGCQLDEVRVRKQLTGKDAHALRWHIQNFAAANTPLVLEEVASPDSGQFSGYSLNLLSAKKTSFTGSTGKSPNIEELAIADASEEILEFAT